MGTEVVALDESRAWSAVGRAGPLWVEILEGTVLLTVEGDTTDRILTAGAVLEGRTGRRVAATGLSPSRIRVTAPAAPPPLARLAPKVSGRLVRDLLGGALIVVVWLSLWAWVTLGVARPLSTVPPARAATPSAQAS